MQLVFYYILLYFSDIDIHCIAIHCIRTFIFDLSQRRISIGAISSNKPDMFQEEIMTLTD